MRTILWIILVAVAIILYQENNVISNRTGQGIACLEFANSYDGKATLYQWDAVKYADGTLIGVAQSNTHWDFVFILTYVLLMILCSSIQMQQEKNSFLNALLRLNLLLAVLAGLLDVTEDLILLYDLRHVNDPGLYVSSYWATLPKWILSGWVVLVWVVSLIKSAIFNKSTKVPVPVAHVSIVN
jgi:hypothetical protein